MNITRENLDIVQAQAALEAGQHITREGMMILNASYFLKESEGKNYLFMRNSTPRYGVVESPATMDWDDMIASNWRIVSEHTSGDEHKDKVERKPVTIH